MADLPNLTSLSPAVEAALVKKLNAEATNAETSAELDRVMIETDKHRLEQTLATDAMELEAMNMSLDTKRQSYQEWKASDYNQHLFRFVTDVNEESVYKCIKVLDSWSHQDPDCDIKIIFTSGGGGLISGLALFDFILELRQRGHHVTTVVRGYAASMACILLQAGTHRVIGKESWVMMHQVSGGHEGSLGEMADQQKWMEKIQERIINIFTERSGGKKSREEFLLAWERKAHWLSSDDAIEWGVADEIA